MKILPRLLLCILLFGSPAGAATPECFVPAVTEAGAIESSRTDALDRSVAPDSDMKPSVFREDVNGDGLQDVFISFDCGNNSCNFSLFLGLHDGQLCPVKGEIFLTAGAAKRIISIQNNGDLIVFAGPMGANSGIVARYRLKAGKLSEIKQLSFGSGKYDFQTYDEAVNAAVGK